MPLCLAKSGLSKSHLLPADEARLKASSSLFTMRSCAVLVCTPLNASALPQQWAMRFYWTRDGFCAPPITRVVLRQATPNEWRTVQTARLKKCCDHAPHNEGKQLLCRGLGEFVE
jgi:hypothetical protein